MIADLHQDDKRQNGNDDLIGNDKEFFPIDQAKDKDCHY